MDTKNTTPDGSHTLPVLSKNTVDEGNRNINMKIRYLDTKKLVSARVKIGAFEKIILPFCEEEKYCSLSFPALRAIIPHHLLTVPCV